MNLDGYLPALEEEIGPAANIEEWCPGMFFIEVDQGSVFMKEYFVVLDEAPMAAKVRNYGKKMDGLRLFAQDDDSSGWRIVQYEISKYSFTVKGNYLPEEMFQDMSLHAMELHPEYFGTFPVPYRTPSGCTLRYRTLDNGIYWLETSRCKELLAVCFPIWNAELSPASASLAKLLLWDAAIGIKKAMGYIFFTKESSCVPIYELMMTRQKWDGTVIDVPALMNALWKYAPKYAVHLNGGKTQVLDDKLAKLLGKAGQEAIPQPDGKHMIGMFPDAGTDFLLLE